MSNEINNATVAKDMNGKEVRIGDTVAYAVITGYSKRAALRTGKVVGAVIDSRGTLLRIEGVNKVSDWRGQAYDRRFRYSTRTFHKLMVIG